MTPDIFLAFLALLLIVAFLYASVGHGGASGYLAMMALFSFDPAVMRPTALLLNVLVSAMAFWQYSRQGHFRWALFWPFALASVPASFLGGMLTVDPALYKRLLGLLLLFAVFRLVVGKWGEERDFDRVPLGPALLAGALIGFFSGLVGIGGGIILSPLILLLHWANMRQTAAVSALFILVNSLAGLAGLLTDGLQADPLMPWMVGAAFVGGLLGSWSGAARLHLKQLRVILAIVLFVASVKLILT